MPQGLPQFNVWVQNDFCSETIPLNATSVSASVSWFLPSSAKNRSVMVTNAGPSTAFIQFGTKTAGVTAVVPGTNGTVGATPVLSGAIYNFDKQSDNSFADTCAAICSGSGTCTVYFTSVQGS